MSSFRLIDFAYCCMKSYYVIIYNALTCTNVVLYNVNKFGSQMVHKFNKITCILKMYSFTIEYIFIT